MDIESFEPSTTGEAYLAYAFTEPWEIETGANITLQALKTAHGSAATAWKAIHDQHQRFSNDGTRTPLANLQRSAAAARKRQAEHEHMAKSAVEAAERHLLAIDEELERYVSPPSSTLADAQVAGEIRAHVKGLRSHEDREAFVQGALKNRDFASVRAVLAAPPYLSGTISLTQARWRGEYLGAVAPAIAQTRQNMVDGIKLVFQAGRALDRHTQQLIDFKKANDLDALAKELESSL